MKSCEVRNICYGIFILLLILEFYLRDTGGGGIENRTDKNHYNFNIKSIILIHFSFPTTESLNLITLFLEFSSTFFSILKLSASYCAPAFSHIETQQYIDIGKYGMQLDHFMNGCKITVNS